MTGRREGCALAAMSGWFPNCRACSASGASSGQWRGSFGAYEQRDRQSHGQTLWGRVIPYLFLGLLSKRHPSSAREYQKTGNDMAERETSSGLFTDLANSMIGNIREIAARTIDANVNFAKQILDFQAQTTNWAKNTPMGPMFQSQRALGEELIELFASAARALWRIRREEIRELSMLRLIES